MTVLEIIQKTSEFLAKKGIESPRLQIELLLSHVLKLPRMKLYLNFERELKEEELEQLRALVKRRAAREPLQHIVGVTQFCGIEIKTTPAALVPRQETEGLVELALSFLKTWNEEPKILDIGTGTGCIILALATKRTDLQAVATDISRCALELAQENATKLGLADKIRFIEGDAFASLGPQESFALIVSNPPYIPDNEIDTLEPEVKNFDPRLALAGGTDGLNYFRNFAEAAAHFLQPQGGILLEFGDGQEAEILKLFAETGWAGEIHKDLSGTPRFYLGTRFS